MQVEDRDKVSYLDEGTAFGEMALFSRTERTATVRAVTLCVCNAVHRGFISHALGLLDPDPASPTAPQSGQTGQMPRGNLPEGRALQGSALMCDDRGSISAGGIVVDGGAEGQGQRSDEWRREPILLDAFDGGLLYSWDAQPASPHEPELGDGRQLWERFRNRSSFFDVQAPRIPGADVTLYAAPKLAEEKLSAAFQVHAYIHIQIHIHYIHI